MDTEQKIKEIQRLANEVNDDTSLGKEQHLQLLQTLQHAVEKTRTPDEFLWEMMLYPQQYAAMRVALELDLAGQVAKQGKATAQQLADATKADKVLIVRIMRVMTALGVFTEIDREQYAHGKISQYLDKDRNLGDGVKIMFDFGAPPASRLPEYLAKNGHKNPSGRAGIWELAYGDGSNVFAWLGSRPESLQHFQNLMVVQRSTRLGWLDIFPVQERIIDGFDSANSDVLLVDIGGGRGSELEGFKKKFPDAPGKLILQDLPQVIESCPHLDEHGIVRQAHDFFTPQPVKDARVYYFRSIFHDWPDDKCIEILKNTRSAMKKGYSKILINDWVLPDIGAHLYPATLDMHMMALFSGMERSKAQFQELIDAAGLRMTNVWSPPDTEGCIEVTLPE